MNPNPNLLFFVPTDRNVITSLCVNRWMPLYETLTWPYPHDNLIHLIRVSGRMCIGPVKWREDQGQHQDQGQSLWWRGWMLEVVMWVWRLLSWRQQRRGVKLLSPLPTLSLPPPPTITTPTTTTTTSASPYQHLGDNCLRRIYRPAWLSCKQLALLTSATLKVRCQPNPHLVFYSNYYFCLTISLISTLY